MKFKWGIITASIIATLGGGIVTFNNLHSIDAAAAEQEGLNISQLSNNYGITLTPESRSADDFKTTPADAIKATKDFTGYQGAEPKIMDMTITQNSMVRITPADSAFNIDNGLVNNYPVWVVRVTGLHLPAHLPALSKNATSAQLANWKAAENKAEDNTEYTFIDASNDQVLFSVDTKE